jgi:hypothetical protein
LLDTIDFLNNRSFNLIELAIEFYIWGFALNACNLPESGSMVVGWTSLIPESGYGTAEVQQHAAYWERPPAAACVYLEWLALFQVVVTELGSWARWLDPRAGAA